MCWLYIEWLQVHFNHSYLKEKLTSYSFQEFFRKVPNQRDLSWMFSFLDPILQLINFLEWRIVYFIVECKVGSFEDCFPVRFLQWPHIGRVHIWGFEGTWFVFDSYGTRTSSIGNERGLLNYVIMYFLNGIYNRLEKSRNFYLILFFEF